MIATSPAKSSQSQTLHPLARFVTKEAIALLLNRPPKEIYRIDCWRHVIHVVGKGISRFVSYADLPPVLGVEPPTHLDIWRWRKRCTVQKQKHAPKFWVDFYTRKFEQAICMTNLVTWRELLETIKQIFSVSTWQQLHSTYISIEKTLQQFN